MDDFPEINEITPIEDENAEQSLPKNREVKQRKDLNMKEKNDGKGYVCPICKSEIPLSIAGKGSGGTKFLICTSPTCKKPPFNFTLFYMPSSRAPVIWPLEFGSVHQINSNETKLS